MLSSEKSLLLMDAVDAILVPDTKNIACCASSDIITFSIRPYKFFFIDLHSLPALIRYPEINSIIIIILIPLIHIRSCLINSQFGAEQTIPNVMYFLQSYIHSTRDSTHRKSPSVLCEVLVVPIIEHLAEISLSD